jgi:hypothetical protein
MYSLRMLLAVVAISAVYIAGMTYRTAWWHASILTLTYLIYAAAISAAILAKQHRAFFVVFVVFGLAYLWFPDRANMPIQLILNKLGKYEPHAMSVAQFERFNSIGHSLFALIMSLLAGVIAEAVVRRSNRPNGQSAGS